MTQRKVVVTGGTQGIGAEICKTLKEKGYDVAATYYQNDEAAKAFSDSTGLPVFKFDVSRLESCERGFEEIKEKIGAPEILINNAGVTSDCFFHKMSFEQWDRVIKTNLYSLFHVTRQVLPSMRDRRFGRIITISSVNAERGQIGQTNYSTAKAGVFGFTRSLAREVAELNITVNVVSPGYIESEMVEKVPPGILSNIIERIPMKRLGKAEEVAEMVALLASEEASYITGAILDVNGGYYFS